VIAGEKRLGQTTATGSAGALRLLLTATAAGLLLPAAGLALLLGTLVLILLRLDLRRGHGDLWTGRQNASRLAA
jgi:hypothetical protein